MLLHQSPYLPYQTLGQNGQNSPKSGPSKYRISVSQEKGASGFCMDANRRFASLLQQGLRFKA